MSGMRRGGGLTQKHMTVSHVSLKLTICRRHLWMVPSWVRSPVLFFTIFSQAHFHATRRNYHRKFSVFRQNLALWGIPHPSFINEWYNRRRFPGISQCKRKPRKCWSFKASWPLGFDLFDSEFVFFLTFCVTAGLLSSLETDLEWFKF